MSGSPRSANSRDFAFSKISLLNLAGRGVASGCQLHQRLYDSLQTPIRSGRVQSSVRVDITIRGFYLFLMPVGQGLSGTPGRAYPVGVRAFFCSPCCSRPAAAWTRGPGRAAQKARAAVDALPVEARLELRRLYFLYGSIVKSRSQGWETGLLSDAVIETSTEPFKPARLLDDEKKNRRKELAN